MLSSFPAPQNHRIRSFAGIQKLYDASFGSKKRYIGELLVRIIQGVGRCHSIEIEMDSNVGHIFSGIWISENLENRKNDRRTS